MISTSCRNRGFTVVEILAVTGIIIVLIGLLYPSLIEARKSGQKTVTIQNMRSLIQAAAIYREDQDDWPRGETFMGLAPLEVFCDPLDTYEGGCRSSRPFLAGSMAWRPNLALQINKELQAIGKEEGTSYALIGAPFSSKEKVNLRFAEKCLELGLTDCIREAIPMCGKDYFETCRMPNPRLLGFADGSVRHVPSGNNLMDYANFLFVP